MKTLRVEILVKMVNCVRLVAVRRTLELPLPTCPDYSCISITYNKYQFAAIIQAPNFFFLLPKEKKRKKKKTETKDVTENCQLPYHFPLNNTKTIIQDAAKKDYLPLRASLPGSPPETPTTCLCPPCLSTTPLL